MPIYAYRCSNNHHWEEMRSMADSTQSLTTCSVCKEVGQKVPSAPNLVFNGPGWTPINYPDRKENK